MRLPDILHVDTERSSPGKAAQKITIIGMVLDLVIGSLKVLVGLLFNSIALVADGIHSFTDVVTDLMVLWISRYAHEEPDENHPYGHGRFETLGTLILGSFLIAIAGAMAWDSLVRLIFTNEHLVVASWPTLVVASLSVLSKEWIFRYTRRIGEALNSNLLIANAWHSRTDALSSVIVFFALIGAMAGVLWLDALAGLVVALIIAKVGWDLAWDNVKVLVDTSAPSEDVEKFKQVILAIDEVRSVHSLRSRQMGSDLLLDVHLQVDPKISVSEGHQIGLEVCHQLRTNFPQIVDITYHIDAEDDAELNFEEAVARGKVALPLRKEATELLVNQWQALISPVNTTFRLHYLRNRVHVELLVVPDRSTTLNSIELREQLKKAAACLEWLGEVEVWYSPARPLAPSTETHHSSTI